MTDGGNPTPPSSQRLAGRCIALPEHRELDKLATMLEAEGASVVRCPLMAILEAPDPAPIEEWLRALAVGRFDDVIFMTGEGVNRLHAVAEAAGIAPAVLAGLGKVRKITRGPKPARALHGLGVGIDLAATTPTSAGVMDVLRGQALGGRQIGLQLYGDDPNRDLVAFLENKGASVFPVAPYRYAPALDEEKVVALIEHIAASGSDGGCETRGERPALPDADHRGGRGTLLGSRTPIDGERPALPDADHRGGRGTLLGSRTQQIDGVAFTAAMQIDRLFKVAEKIGARERLLAGLQRIHVAAVGPIVVEALGRHGVHVDTVPARQFFMRRLTQAMAEQLGPRDQLSPRRV